MKVHINWSDEDIRVNKYKSSVIVLIDVLRASTFISVALYSKAKDVIIVRDMDKAIKLKKRFPSSILAGERSGVKIEGFDIGNSPHNIRALGKNKRIILSSGNFCSAINFLPKNVPILAGSIVNAREIAQYIFQKKFDEVFLIATGTYHFKGRKYKKALRTEEDMLGAAFIAHELSKLTKDKMNFRKYGKIFKNNNLILNHIINTPYAKYLLGMDKKEENKKDIIICGSANKYPCIPIYNKKLQGFKI